MLLQSSTGAAVEAGFLTVWELSTSLLYCFNQLILLQLALPKSMPTEILGMLMPELFEGSSR